MRRRRRPSSRLHDRLVAVALAATSVSAVVWSLPHEVRAAPAPVPLSSSWSDTLNSQFEDTWEPAMRTKTEQVVEVDNAISIGDDFAKQALVKGQRDFVVTGSRLTAADLAKGKNKTESSYISIPISAVGQAIAMRAPISSNGVGWFDVTLTPVDPVTGDGGDFLFTPYNGPINMPTSLLADLIQGRFQALNNPRFTADNKRSNGTSLDLAHGDDGVAVLARSDPGAMNVHFQHLFAVQTPTVWNQMLALYKLPAGYFGDDWAVTESPTRSLDNSLMSALADQRSPTGGFASGGTIGVSTPGRITAARVRFPLVDIRALRIKNAAGAYVAPTADAITAGILGGLRTDSTGALVFTEDAALIDQTLTNAYPLTWLNWLHAPTTGLTVEKTNALATMVRYIVTDGNAANVTVGDAVLPPVLVKEALAKADALVASNCVGADRKLVTRTDPGPYAPDKKLTGVTSMNWCEVVVAPPQTTTAAPTTTVAPTTTKPPTTTTTTSPTTTTLPPTTTAEPFVPPANNGAQVLGATQSRTTVPPATTAVTTTTTVPVTTTTAPTVQPVTAAPVADPVQLPFGDPEPATSGFDRLTTMVVGGGGLFGAVRKWFRGGR